MSEDTVGAVMMGEGDDVAVLLGPADRDTTITLVGDDPGLTLRSCEEIPAFHKIALRHIARDENIVRCGTVIGVATQEIKPGQLVHTHNIRSRRAQA